MRRLLLILFLAAAVTGAWVARRQFTALDTPYGRVDAEQFVDITPGLGTKAIGRVLVDAGVVPDVTTWRLAVWRSGRSTSLKAGEYRFAGPATPMEIVARLARGDVYLRSVTFPEGLTIRQMASVYEQAGLGAAIDFVTAAGDERLVSAVDAAARNLEGYLFPDTYSLPRRASARDLVERMVRRFNTVMTDDLRARAGARGLDLRQAVTLASLVEKETASPAERPVVAAVYLNRLRQGIGLQCDPTVIYALELRGRFNGNLTRADLSLDSPYNTYRYRGLPPGPIAAPGRSALEAVASPAAVDYLYFVSRNDGTHAFASTLAEHNRNVRKYQVEFFRRSQKSEDRRQKTEDRRQKQGVRSQKPEVRSQKGGSLHSVSCLLTSVRGPF